MRGMLAWCLVAAVTVARAGEPVAVPSPQAIPPQYQVDLTVVDQAPDGTSRVVARPRLIATEDEPGVVEIGAQMPAAEPAVAREMIFSDVRCRLRIFRSPDSQKRYLSAECESSDPLPAKPGRLRIATRGMRFAQPLKLDKKTVVPLGKIKPGGEAGEPLRRRLEIVVHRFSRDEAPPPATKVLPHPEAQRVELRTRIIEVDAAAAKALERRLDTHDEMDLMTAVAFLRAVRNPYVLSGDDAAAAIAYLEKHKVVHVGSEPTLVTVSGKPVSFAAGGEFTLPAAPDADFHAFGVITSFLAVVLDKDHIRLQVMPNFSEIDSDTPGLNTPAVTTTVEMREGQTLAIPGLTKSRRKGTRDGDSDGSGLAGERRRTRRSPSHLLMLVTPVLAEKAAAAPVPSAGTGTGDP